MALNIGRKPNRIMKIKPPKNPVGRPPAKVPKVSLSVKIEPETLAKFQADCIKRGISQAKQVAAWIDDNR